MTNMGGGKKKIKECRRQTKRKKKTKQHNKLQNVCKKAEEKQPSDTLGFYELFSTPLKDLLPRFVAPTPPPLFNRCRQPDEMRRLSVLRRLAGTKLNVPGVSPAWNPEAAGKKKKKNDSSIWTLQERGTAPPTTTMIPCSTFLHIHKWPKCHLSPQHFL